jgi:phenylacetate-CoA ligase
MATIVVTDLNNYRMPLVRYALGDVGCWKDGACDCGRGLPLMEISVGRVGDLIHLPNGRRLHPDLLDLPHDDGVLFDNVRQYRIVQQSLTDFSIQVAVRPGSEGVVRECFARFVKERLGEEVRLNFAFPAEIPRERSGKLRYFVSALDTPIVYDV